MSIAPCALPWQCYTESMSKTQMKKAVRLAQAATAEWTRNRDSAEWQRLEAELAALWARAEA